MFLDHPCGLGVGLGVQILSDRASVPLQDSLMNQLKELQATYDKLRQVPPP